MVKQLERNATNFLQEEYASDNPIEQEVSIGNLDVDTHVSNVVEILVLIDKLKKHNTLAAQHLMKEWPHNLRLRLNKSNFWLRKLKPCMSMPKP